MLIEYSDGPCENRGGWNVPRDTVISITIVPKVKPRLTDLQLDERKYKKVEDEELFLVDLFYYINEEEGITYDVQSGVVDSIKYGPAAKDAHLRCPPVEGRAFTNAGRPCPTVKVECPTSIIESGMALTLTALIEGLSPKFLSTYKWSVSAGTISSGQGTPTLTIDTGGLKARTITARVEVAGFPIECLGVASCSLPVAISPRKDSQEKKGKRRSRQSPKQRVLCKY